jgi:hypothetical protein
MFIGVRADDAGDLAADVADQATQPGAQLPDLSLGQHRSTQRKAPTVPDDEAAVRDEIVALAKLYGRYGYRRVTVLCGCGLVHQPQARRAPPGLAARVAEGAAAAAEARPSVAERRLLHPAAAGAA